LIKVSAIENQNFVQKPLNFVERKKCQRERNKKRFFLGSALNRIDSVRIDYDRIDSNKINFERIDLCLDTMM